MYILMHVFFKQIVMEKLKSHFFAGCNGDVIVYSSHQPKHLSANSIYKYNFWDPTWLQRTWSYADGWMDTTFVKDTQSMYAQESFPYIYFWKQILVPSSKIDCPNSQLQGNLTMIAVIRVFAANRSPLLRILKEAQLGQWMLEEVDSLELCKSSQVRLKGYPRKVYSEIPEPLCKAEDVSKAWWAYGMKVFSTTNLRDSQLCCLGLIYAHAARGLEILL